MLPVSQAARVLAEQPGTEVRPQTLSNLFYQRVLPDNLCPLVGGRRSIPRDCLPAIAAVLRQPGRIEAHTEGGDE